MKASVVLNLFCAVLVSASVLPRGVNRAREVKVVEMKGPVKDIWSEGNVKRDFDPEEFDDKNEVGEVEHYDGVDVDEYDDHDGLDKREEKSVCRWGGKGPASAPAIRDGMSYIKDNWDGYDCQVEAGPSKCKRFTCSWNSAIWLCNDTKETLKVPCRDIASMAGKIIDTCGWYDWEPMVQGQRFTGNKEWNVIVGKDSC